MKLMDFKMGIMTMVFCFGFVAVSSAQAQRGNDRKEPPTYAQLLKEMDANEDGKLAKAEVKGPLKESFDKIDTDEDSFISKKEFKNVPKPKGRARGNKK